MATLPYKEALQLWGAQLLNQAYDHHGTGQDQYILNETVTVSFDFDEGFACCGGSDPDCYCSLASSPEASVTITARTATGGTLYHSIDASSFDFATVIGEIVAAGGGTLTA